MHKVDFCTVKQWWNCLTRLNQDREAMSLPRGHGRRVWKYQRGNQNPYFEVEQTTQRPKDKVLNGKQRSTKHTHKTKDRVTRTQCRISL